MSRIHEALRKAEEERAAVLMATAATADIVNGEPEGIALVNKEMAPSADDTAHAMEPPIASGEASVVPPLNVVGSVGIQSVLEKQEIRFDDLKFRCAHPEWHPDPNAGVFFNPELSKHGAEQFRTLRSRLYQIRSNQKLGTLLITSSIPGEGKTFVCVNLAHAIVRQPDRRVIIIDADLRCPRVHTLLGAPSTPGLSEYLRGEADELGVIQLGPEENLCLIPGGSQVSNPSELLSNGRLSNLVKRLSRAFDWVILDSPPCLPVADANILADVCDGILFVVKAGSTPAALAQRAQQELRKRNVLGVVLNAIGETHLGGSHYYQAYSYGYGVEDEKPTQTS